MNVLAIVPARGGSKGLPGKNIKSLGGQPMISYTATEALKSKYIDRLILSTDDDEIARVGEICGIENPFARPTELAMDTSRAIDTFIYTIGKMEKEFAYYADIIVILQPTSPLRTVEDIDGAIELLMTEDADSVVSICEVEHSPYWYKMMDSKGRLNQFIKDVDFNANRQELGKIYRPNGAVYVFKRDLIMVEKTYYTQNSYGYIMRAENSIDVDTILDFKFAEMLLGEGE